MFDIQLVRGTIRSLRCFLTTYVSSAMSAQDPSASPLSEVRKLARLGEQNKGESDLDILV